MNKFLQDPTPNRTLYYSKQKFSLKHQGIFDSNCKKKRERRAQENLYKPDKTAFSSEEDANQFGSSAHIILSHRRITYDKQYINRDDVSLIQENELFSEKFPALKILQCTKQVLPQIPSPANISQIRLQTRQQLAKPLLKKQKSLDFISQMQFQNKEFIQLHEGANLVCLFKSQIQIEDHYDKVLLLNFDNILFKKQCSFWEQKNQIINCNYGLGGNQFEYCDSAFCVCNLRKDLKQTLKILQKNYLIILITDNPSFTNIWHKYFQEQAYNYDAIYKIKYPKDIILGGLKLHKIIDDFHKHKIKKLVYIDSVDQVNNQQIYPEIFQYKLPIIQENIEVVLFFIKQQCYKLLDFQFFLNICTSYQNGKENVLTRRQVIFENIDLSNIFDYFLQQELLKKQMIKEIKDKKENYQMHFLLSQYQIDKSFDAQQKEDFLIEWITETRNDFLDDFKHKRTERVPQLFFQIGDLIVRNQKYKLIQTIQQNRHYRKITRNLINSKKREKDRFNKKDQKIKLNCFFIQD